MKNKIFTVLFLFLVFSNVAPLYAQKKGGILDLYEKGLSFQQDENFYLASQYYLEVVSQNPAFTEAWIKLADCSYKLGEFDLALDYIEKAESYEKNKSEILNLKGMVYIALGRIDDARAIFNNVLKVYPNDVDSHFGLAEIELYEGRFSGAENQYSEALKRQSTNRKALLSLALVCAEREKYEQSEIFLRQALSYYSGDSEVHYLAAVIYAMQGDYKTAEKHSRIAVEVNGDYDKAYELLAIILYQQKRYSEVVDISDFLIGKSRNNYKAWYLKGVALSKLGKNKDAISVWSTGLTIQPNDELMRSAMEMEIRDYLPLDDSRRSEWALYHINNAKQYQSRYDGAGAVYEYQRALVLDPLNYEARIAYANLLELNGMYEIYLEQLKFIEEHKKDSLSKKQLTQLNDKIEAYEDLLKNTLATEWQVEPFYLDKIRWNIAIFYEEDTSSFLHADTNKLAAKAAADIFSGVAITSVKTQVTPVSGFGEAFSHARNGKFDYFVILSMSEGQNDLTLNSTIYNGRTGLEIAKNSFYGTGNNRFSLVLRRFRNSVLEKLTVRGKILKRNGKNVLVDLGKSEKVIPGAEFKIIRKNQIKTADSQSGLVYKDSDLVGSLVISQAGEEISSGVIERKGFYDHINEDDEVILVSLPSSGENGQTSVAIDNVPVADESGNTLVENNVNAGEIVDEIRKAVERPSIIELLRNIY